MTNKPKPHGSYLHSILAFLVGVFLGGLCLFANFQFGHSLGLTELGKLTQSLLTVGIDLGFAVSAAVTGWLLARRSWASILTGLMALAFGAFTLISLVGWGALERVAKADIALAEAKAERDLAKDTNELILKERSEFLSWARNTTTKRSARGSREEILGTVKDVMNEPPKLMKVIDPAIVSADAQADVLTRILAAANIEIDQRNVLIIMIAWLATLAILGKGFFLALGAYLWPVRDIARREDSGRTQERTSAAEIAKSARSLPQRADNDVEPAAISAADLATGDEIAAEGKVTVYPARAADAAISATDLAHNIDDPREIASGTGDVAQRSAVDLAQASDIATESSTVSPARGTDVAISATDLASRREAIAQRSGADLARGIDDPREIAELVVSAIDEPSERSSRRTSPSERQHQLALVKLFLEQETRPARDARYTATFFHEHFKRWVARKKLGIEMSLNAFGSLCAELGVQKLHNGRHVCYLDLAPVTYAPAQEVPEAAAA